MDIGGTKLTQYDSKKCGIHTELEEYDRLSTTYTTQLTDASRYYPHTPTNFSWLTLRYQEARQQQYKCQDRWIQLSRSAI